LFQGTPSTKPIAAAPTTAAKHERTPIIGAQD
jgi:hypothetical protein